MASRQTQAGFIGRNYSADQVFAFEALDSKVFDRTLQAVNSRDLSVTRTAYEALAGKVNAGYVLTPMTSELFELCKRVLGKTPAASLH